MKCDKYKEMIFDSVEGDQRRHEELIAHCATCASCRRQVEDLSQVKHLVRAMPRHSAPREVGLAVRVEYSRQASFTYGDRFWMGVENFLRPLALPAAAGVLLAILFFSVMLDTLWMSPALANASDDVQLSVRTAPRSRPNNYLPIAMEGSYNLPDEPILVETRVDPHGRVVDFKVLSGPSGPLVIQRLEQVLYFTVFDPATSFGRPTDGKAILSFRTVRVLG
jgi:hypothetical protein